MRASESWLSRIDRFTASADDVLTRCETLIADCKCGLSLQGRDVRGSQDTGGPANAPSRVTETLTKLGNNTGAVVVAGSCRTCSFLEALLTSGWAAEELVGLTNSASDFVALLQAVGRSNDERLPRAHVHLGRLSDLCLRLQGESPPDEGVAGIIVDVDSWQRWREEVLTVLRSACMHAQAFLVLAFCPQQQIQPSQEGTADNLMDEVMDDVMAAGREAGYHLALAGSNEELAGFQGGDRLLVFRLEGWRCPPDVAAASTAAASLAVQLRRRLLCAGTPATCQHQSPSLENPPMASTAPPPAAPAAGVDGAHPRSPSSAGRVPITTASLAEAVRLALCTKDMPAQPPQAVSALLEPHHADLVRQLALSPAARALPSLPGAKRQEELQPAGGEPSKRAKFEEAEGLVPVMEGEAGQEGAVGTASSLALPTTDAAPPAAGKAAAGNQAAAVGKEPNQEGFPAVKLKQRAGEVGDALTGGGTVAGPVAPETGGEAAGGGAEGGKPGAAVALGGKLVFQPAEQQPTVPILSVVEDKVPPPASRPMALHMSAPLGTTQQVNQQHEQSHSTEQGSAVGKLLQHQQKSTGAPALAQQLELSKRQRRKLRQHDRQQQQQERQQQRQQQIQLPHQQPGQQPGHAQRQQQTHQRQQQTQVHMSQQQKSGEQSKGQPQPQKRSPIAMLGASRATPPSTAARASQQAATRVLKPTSVAGQKRPAIGQPAVWQGGRDSTEVKLQRWRQDQAAKEGPEARARQATVARQWQQQRQRQEQLQRQRALRMGAQQPLQEPGVVGTGAGGPWVVARTQGLLQQAQQQQMTRPFSPLQQQQHPPRPQQRVRVAAAASQQGLLLTMPWEEAGMRGAPQEQRVIPLQGASLVQQHSQQQGLLRLPAAQSAPSMLGVEPPTLLQRHSVGGIAGMHAMPGQHSFGGQVGMPIMMQQPGMPGQQQLQMQQSSQALVHVGGVQIGGQVLMHTQAGGGLGVLLQRTGLTGGSRPLLMAQNMGVIPGQQGVVGQQQGQQTMMEGQLPRGPRFPPGY